MIAMDSTTHNKFDPDKFENRIQEMYNILINISSELFTIKQRIMIDDENVRRYRKASFVSENGGEDSEEEDVRRRYAPNGQTVSSIGSNNSLFINRNSSSMHPSSSSAKIHPITEYGPIKSTSNFYSTNATLPKYDGERNNLSQCTKTKNYRSFSVRDNQEPIILNVGGKTHEVMWDTLDKFPRSRLGRLRHCNTQAGIQELCDGYYEKRCEYFFDRSPRNFDAILGLYRTGKLHLSQGVCVQDFSEELEYWGLCDLHLEPCCQHTYYRARWLLPHAQKTEDDIDAYFGNGMCTNVQKKLWNLLENPNSSHAAKIVAVLSCLFVVASTLSLIISTLPTFQNNSGTEEEEHYVFAIAEAAFVGWFTFEYIVRFIASPQKWRFIKAAMNIIDLLGVIPYYLSLMLSIINTTGRHYESSSKYQEKMMRIAQIFRIMRILRIFKLARHITGLQTLGYTLKNSYKELGLLMLVVIMGMLIFSGLAYVSEKNEIGTAFISMPQALYWAIITMTSVGYGDIYPTTAFGKIVGSGCAICGVLCISLPIPIIVNNFNKFYEKAKIEEEIEAKRKRTSWEDAKRDLMDARRKSCMSAARDWKRLFKVSNKILQNGNISNKGKRNNSSTHHLLTSSRFSASTSHLSRPVLRKSPSGGSHQEVLVLSPHNLRNSVKVQRDSS